MLVVMSAVIQLLNLRNNKHSNKGGYFLKKLWCCVGGRVQQDNLVSSTELIM